MSKTIYYHFSNGYLAHHKPPMPIESGYVYYETGRPILCRHGMHASRRVIDALAYAPGPVLSKCYLRDHVIHGYDKSVALEREVIAVADVTDILRHFARLCALDVVHLWDCPEVVMHWLKTGEESLRSAAWNAAWNAAESAAESAARSAACSAACSAAESAAWSAGPCSAERAAWSAAWSAAWNAAWNAAESAACSAARSAARDKQNKRLTRMIDDADWR